MKMDQQMQQPYPRPLPLHLSAAMTNMISSLAALPSERKDSLSWQTASKQKADKQTADLTRSDPLALFWAVAVEC